VNLRRGEGGPLVIGHRGASLAAPENSREALEAAVAAGADLVEFDVTHGLVVAHEAGRPGLHLYQALELLAPHRIGLHIDLKETGTEAAVIDAVDAYGLRERVVVSTALAPIARAVSRLAPALPLAIGYPRDRYRVSRIRWPDAVTRPGAATLRALMPARIPLLLRVARANTLALHHTLCSRRAVDVAHRFGAPVLAWTANDPARIRALAAIGVDAIVTDDPRTCVQVLAAIRP
jgi:glycerophosphoryl diester phosphodiesterase